MIVIPKVNGSLLQNNGADYFLLKDKIGINVGDFAPWVINSFAERVRQSGVIEAGITCNEADITLIGNSRLEPEGYTVEIGPSSIILSASTEKGVIWGLATLYQMIVEGRHTRLNRIGLQTFSDAPKYSHRGLLLDVGRHFFDPDEVKKIIDEMSIYKLNVLHWHLSEDQGWRIESKVYPKLHENASNGQYYTQQQIKDIVQYAMERGIEIIPEIDMPGHSSAAISAYKELSCFDEEIPVAKSYGVFKVIMCAGKESTYQWIRNLLDEVTELFPSKLFHLGGDECPKDKWKRCPHCEERMLANNLKDYEDLQGYFMNEISEYLHRKGKTVIGWNENLKANNVPKDMVIQYWLENTPESYAYPFFEAGQKMIFSDMFHFYFDYPHCMVKLRKTYEYQPKIRDHIDLTGEPILGLEGAIWTERVLTNEQLETMISLRIQALAEAAWTNERNYEDFLSRLKAHIETNQINKLTSLPFEEVALSDEQAMQTALVMMKAMASSITENYTDTGITEEERDRISRMFHKEIFGDTDIQKIAKS